jgi:protein tyrosine phosphatase (PTP) superfamily phosphohydrolase (DUF442 family)
LKFIARLMLLVVAAVPVMADDEVGLLELLNYHEYSPSLMSSGQPTREQFSAISAAGVETVINLAPTAAPDALADEAELVASLNMGYAHIPVDWEAPPLADVERFLEVMQVNAGRRVLVHCYANARASAFVFIHRVLRAGQDVDDARATLISIWDMNPGYELHTVAPWQALIDTALTSQDK